MSFNRLIRSNIYLIAPLKNLIIEKIFYYLHLHGRVSLNKTRRMTFLLNNIQEYLFREEANR